jgi:hypothetical protein
MHQLIEKQNYSLPFLIAALGLMVASFASADEPASKPIPTKPPQQQKALNKAAISDLKGLGLGENVTAPRAEINTGPTNSVTIQNKTPYELRVYRNGVPWEDQGMIPSAKRFHFPAEIVPGGVITFTNVVATKAEKILILLRAKELKRAGCEVERRDKGVCTWNITVGTDDPPRTILVSTNDFLRPN